MRMTVPPDMAAWAQDLAMKPTSRSHVAVTKSQHKSLGKAEAKDRDLVEIV